MLRSGRIFRGFVFCFFCRYFCIFPVEPIGVELISLIHTASEGDCGKYPSWRTEEGRVGRLFVLCDREPEVAAYQLSWRRLPEKGVTNFGTILSN